MTYHFEVQQELRFSVYDVDNKSTSLENHDFLGNCTTTLGQVRNGLDVIIKLFVLFLERYLMTVVWLEQVVSAGTLKLPLRGGGDGVRINKGQVIIHVEELSASKDEVSLQFRGWQLNRNDWCGWYVYETLAIIRSYLDNLQTESVKYFWCCVHEVQTKMVLHR